jgi:hypothetical protein
VEHYVQGFLNQPREGQGHTSYLAWTRKMKGTLGRISQGACEQSLLYVEVPLCLLLCFILCLRHSIHIHLS